MYLLSLSLLFLLYSLAGFPPFWHRKQLVLLRSIMEGKYEFVSPEWDDISDHAKDLVSLSVCLSGLRLSEDWFLLTSLYVACRVLF